MRGVGVRRSGEYLLVCVGVVVCDACEVIECGVGDISVGEWRI